MPPDRKAALDQTLVTAVSRMLNELLHSDDNAMQKLQQLDGQIVAICVRDTSLVAYARACIDGIQLVHSHEGEVDVRVTGSTADFIAYARASKRGDSIGAGRIEISGDLATAQSVQALLSELQIDWEEILSRYIGDIGAHQAGRLVRAVTAWGTDAAVRLEQDIAEYLQIEARVLPTRRDAERLGRAVFILADDVDRLEARVRRIEQKK